MSLESKILQLADRCVKCGLCLPHCPTYRQDLNENESPRGRIALLQGLAEGQLSPDHHLRDHIARCLDCRNCERVCPAGVQYEHLLDQGRELILQHAKRSGIRFRSKQFVLTLPGRSNYLVFLHRFLRFYQLSGMQWLARTSGLLRLLRLSELERLLPPLRKVRRYKSQYPAQGPQRGRVALFGGCLATTLEQQTLLASIKLLTRLGYTVDMVDGQTCCGAIAMHSGESAQATSLAARNLAAFKPGKFDAIIYTASGCGAQLKNYPRLPWADDSLTRQAIAFERKLQEITAFLSGIEWPESIAFNAGKLRIAVHEPCSQRNGLRQADYATPLLKHLPGVDVVPLPGNHQCCGAAGSYMITQPDMAKKLRQDKLLAISHSKPDCVASTNPGCALFMSAGPGNSEVRVVHPVVLVAERLT